MQFLSLLLEKYDQYFEIDLAGSRHTALSLWEMPPSRLPLAVEITLLRRNKVYFWTDQNTRVSVVTFWPVSQFVYVLVEVDVFCHFFRNQHGARIGVISYQFVSVYSVSAVKFVKLWNFRAFTFNY